MNNLKFLEVMGKIDDDLIRKAYIEIDTKAVKPRRNIYTLGSAAAVAVVALGVTAIVRSNAPSPDKVQNNIVFDDRTSLTTSVSADTVPLTTGIHNEKNNKTTAVSVNDIEAQSTTEKNESASEQSVSVQSHNPVSPGTDTKKTTTRSKTSSNTTTKTTSRTKVSSESTAQATTKTNSEYKGGVNAEHSYYKPFTATVDPYSDSYSEEEEHHVDVRTAEGFYRQLTLDDYAANGISTTVSISDFGGYIGRIIEVNNYDYQGNAAESQEPAIAGADVYYYAPTGNNKAFIIVKSGDQCSMFIADNINVSQGYKKGLAFFDVQSAEDIESIEYRIEVPSDGRLVTSVQNTVNDTAIINEFYNLICQLQPEDYSNLPEHIGTPQWLTEAWDNYRNNPAAPPREDYRITIRLKDGSVLQEIHFQPYLGNGYVEGMKELTPEQNSSLRSLLQ